jgi:hypothetical protein
LVKVAQEDFHVTVSICNSRDGRIDAIVRYSLFTPDAKHYRWSVVMSRALVKGFLAGLAAVGGVLLSTPFIIRAAVRAITHAKIIPHLVAHDVNLAIPWAIGLAGAFLVLSLAAFLVAFDVGSGTFRKPGSRPTSQDLI